MLQNQVENECSIKTKVIPSSNSDLMLHTLSWWRSVDFSNGKSRGKPFQNVWELFLHLEVNLIWLSFTNAFWASCFQNVLRGKLFQNNHGVNSRSACLSCVTVTGSNDFICLIPNLLKIKWRSLCQLGYYYLLYTFVCLFVFVFVKSE